jgi:putative peptidoglycan lipid II flippase
MFRNWRTRLHAFVLREYSIPEASLLFMITFVISACLGIVRQVLFNAEFGTGIEANAFYAAFRLPDTLTNLIAGGTLAGSLIPVLAGVARREGQAAEWQLANLVINTVLALFSLLVILGIIFAPFLVRTFIAPGFDQPTAELTITLTRIMLLQAILGVISSVVMAVLNSRQQFTLSGLSILIHNFTLISGILAARYIPGVGIYGPTYGVIGDAILQLLILLPGMRANRFRFHWAWNLRDRGLRDLGRLMVPSGASAVINYAGTLVDTAFASLAREMAALPALQNANLLIGVPVRLLASAVGQAAFPRMAAQAAASEWIVLRCTLLRVLATTVALALPVMAGLIGVGREVIRLLFERGRFDASAGSLTYAMLVALAFALPAYIGTEILTRGLVALRDTTTPLITNCGQLACRAGIMAALLGNLGAVAIPIAFAISSSLETIALAVALWWKLRRVDLDAAGHHDVDQHQHEQHD